MKTHRFFWVTRESNHGWKLMWNQTSFDYIELQCLGDILLSVSQPCGWRILPVVLLGSRKEQLFNEMICHNAHLIFFLLWLTHIWLCHSNQLTIRHIKVINQWVGQCTVHSLIYYLCREFPTPIRCIRDWLAIKNVCTIRLVIELFICAPPNPSHQWSSNKKYDICANKLKFLPYSLSYSIHKKSDICVNKYLLMILTIKVITQKSS